MKLSLDDIKRLATLYSGQRSISDEHIIQFTLDAMNDLVTRYESAGNKKMWNYLVFNSIKEIEKLINPQYPNPNDYYTRMTVAGSWVELPSGCISIKRCLYNPDNNITNIEKSKYFVFNVSQMSDPIAQQYYYGIKGTPTDDFIIENGYIRFPKTGTYTIEYVGYYEEEDLFGHILS